MTYQELKDRLSKCELTLSKLKDSKLASSTKDIKEKVQQLTLLKESLQVQLAEADKGMVYTDDEDTAKDLADDGANVKLTKEIEGVKFSVDETKTIAKSVGKAVAMAVKNLGDELAHMKAVNIEENSFDIKIEYRNDNEDAFSFYITDDTLHLTDFSFDKELTDVGVKPSGEAQVNVEHLANELTKHFKSMNEKIDSNDKPELKKLSKALSNSVKAHQDQKKALDKAINTEGEVSEAPIGTHYIRVEKSELMEALGILEKAFADSRIRFELNDPDTIYIHNADIHDMHDAVEEVMQNGIIVDETSIDNELQSEGDDTDDYGRPHVDPKGSRTYMSDKEIEDMKPSNRINKIAKEDTDIGHVDDEPDMLQATAYEIATYAAKLSKKLAKYDAHDGEVDFPNWWQAKLILAKDYMSKAYHYLDSEEKQPALDQLALESFIKEGRGDGEAINDIIINMANEDDISTREAAEEIIDHITHIFINTKGKEVGENLTYKEPKGIDKVAGGIPYRREGNKFIISMDLPDDVKERLLKKAKEHGYFAQPNQAGGITITLKKGMNEVDEDRFVRAAFEDLEQVIRNLAHTANISEDEALEMAIRKLEAMLDGRDDLDEKKNIVFSDSAYDMVVHTMKRLAKKYKAGDKSVVKHLKKLTHIKKQLEKAKIAKAAKIGQDQELETDTELREAGPGFKHDCAAKVVHEKYGKGDCIPEQHTLVKEGDKHVVTHYDVLFEEGSKTVKDIPVSELDIKTTNEHWHKGYKKKKK